MMHTISKFRKIRRCRSQDQYSLALVWQYNEVSTSSAVYAISMHKYSVSYDLV